MLGARWRAEIALCVYITSLILMVGDATSDPLAVFVQSASSLRNPARAGWSADWCDCGTGLNYVMVWPGQDKSQAVNVSRNSEDTDDSMPPLWVKWPTPVSTVGWRCDGMASDQQSVNIGVRMAWWTLSRNARRKPFPCSKKSGRLQWAGWTSESYTTSVVYSSGEGGYFCIKIPVLLQTHTGNLLAFAEARRASCSDFAWTDLVVKSSADGGETWSRMRLVRSDSGPALPKTVIGNAAPVQIGPDSGRHAGRILLPHTRNNTDVWETHSDDDGKTWSDAKPLGSNVTRPEWKWVGTGPPGSIQLRSGRLLAPAYHSKFRGNLVNNLVHGHTMFSDDAGDTWQLGARQFGSGDKCRALLQQFLTCNLLGSLLPQRLSSNAMFESMG